MANWQIILIFIPILIAGFVRQRSLIRTKAAHTTLAVEFLENFIQWCNGHARDYSLYNWMLSKSNTVQAMLGFSGVVDLRPPFANYIRENYPVILNEIPGIQKDFHDDLLTINTIAQERLNSRIQMVDGGLRRFIGSAEERIRREQARLLNPLVWLCGGVALIMELPLFILNETKVISTSQRAVIASGRLFSLLSGLVTLGTLIATLMRIVMGWDAFVNALASRFK